MAGNSGGALVNTEGELVGIKPEPLFDGHFRLLQQRLVGERHLKVMVEPVGGGPPFSLLAAARSPAGVRFTCGW